MLSMSEKSLLCLVLVLFVSVVAHGSVDVIDYSTRLEPDITSKSVKGTVSIRFTTAEKIVEFECGDLIVDSVVENGKLVEFSVNNHKLKVSLAAGQGGRNNKRPIETSNETKIEINYHGTPKWGIRFFPARNQVYTIFSTSQWMVCNDDPGDKATFTLQLVLPSNLTAVSNGELTSQRDLPNNKRLTEWRQRSPIPTYIFGFVAGPFKVVKEKHRNVELQYLATNYSEPEIRRIFRATPDMLDFFEARAGMKYADKTYTQVLAAGGVEQEMSSFTALKEAYGKEVLDNEQDLWLAAHEFAHQWWGNMVTCRDWKDRNTTLFRSMSSFTALKEAYGKEVLDNEQDLWLAAHEFAHQWWGNMVTCRDWNHFWLNEGVATFIAAAYLEHRFGRA